MELVPDEAAATAIFEARRWGDEPYCPRCGSEDVYETKNRKPMPFRCRECREHFSVRIGTVMESSRIPLRKWLFAIYLFNTSRKGISSPQMAKMLGLTQKSAWFLDHRIRAAMAHRGGLFKGEVEVDEAYFGGKERDKHESERVREGRGAVGKQAVIGLRERNGDVRAFPIGSTDRVTLHSAIVENVKRGSTIYSDSHVGYIGTHHYISPKHLHRYIDEFAYRQSVGVGNTLGSIMHTIDGMIGRRLTYNRLTS